MVGSTYNRISTAVLTRGWPTPSAVLHAWEGAKQEVGQLY